MATIEPRQQTEGGKVTFRVRWRDANGKGRSKSFQDEREAIRFHAAKELGLEGPEVAATEVAPAPAAPAGTGLTVAEWSEVVAGMVMHAPGTARRWRMTLGKHILPRFGDRPVASVERHEVQAWVKAQAAKGLAPGTIRTNVSVLARIYREALANPVLTGVTTNPTAKLDFGRKVRHEVTPPTTEQVWNLARYMEPQWRAMVIAGAGLGLRSGEARGLTLGQVDFLGRTVRIDRQMLDDTGYQHGPVKSAESNRTLPLPDLVAAELAKHLERWPQADPNGLVFTVARGPRKGLARSARSLNGAMAKAVEGSDLEGMTFHALRHYYASLLIEAGESFKTVQRMLGHQSAALTLDTYGHLWPKDGDTTRAAVDRLLAAPEAPAEAPRHLRAV